ncbi:SURF1 family protein [Endozoicomonas euniceicola]|uniref:SURF1-like protein n=1 Tax=Endozoicomonas euniceicola TaxID=1234143 RepID=A0ABY6H265_9GAMM|nr:SURF1 family protein [Endozoicomonas euniceicola]UYM18328.1 SURF1 family protein [Endozoicomonas euniceicola]
MLKYRIKLSLLVILLLPLLVFLGLWQFSRYEQKLELEQMLTERLAMSPLFYSEVKRFPDPMYLPVTVQGRFDASRYFLRDNQVYEGLAGYELIMPFTTTDGRSLLVNRGWLGSESRETLPDIKTPEAVVELTGTLYRPLGKAFTLGDDIWAESWPKRIQTLDFNKMKTALNLEVPSMLLVLADRQPGALQVRPVTMKTTSGKHLGYSFQWFTMALVLLGLYLWQMIKFRKHQHAGSHL